MSIFPRLETPACGCDAPAHVSRLIGIDEALRRIERHTEAIQGTEALPLTQATGRILAEPVRAVAMTPPFDNAAMDGYAVDTASFTGAGPWTFPVCARVIAGEPSPASLAPATAARIMTGAMVPSGADAVVRQEDACRSGDTVTFERRPDPNLNIRRAGGDMRAGQVVIDAGARLDARRLAACAAAGAGSVPVRRPLRVALLVTGTEVRAAGTDRASAQIWDVNTPMLLAALAGPRIDVIRADRLPDSPDALTDRLAAIMDEADLVVTTGGVSVGEEDHLKQVFGTLGGALHFSGVAIKPGKPVSFGRLGRARWLGLPGNPLAAFITWQMFGVPLAGRLTGQSMRGVARRHVVTSRPIRRTPGRCEIRPAALVGFDGLGREVVEVAEATHSGRVGHLPHCDGLALLPAEADHLPTGALTEFLPFCEA